MTTKLAPDRADTLRPSAIADDAITVQGVRTVKPRTNRKSRPGLQNRGQAMPTRRPSPAPPPPDPEMILFARLVETCMRWPCPECGKAGVCECFRPQTTPSAETKPKGEPGHD